MNSNTDEAFILSLHVACQRAEQDGFDHTKQVLLGMLAREVGQTNAVSARKQSEGDQFEGSERCIDAQLPECQYG